nr:DNA internalization-related competence protein ComEC/Rec2 [Acetatifactor sp.]
HISLLGMGFYHLLRKLRVPMWIAAIAGAVLLTGYGIMTGMSVSACRAIGMYLMRMLGICVGRTYDMQTALGFVVLLMVLQNPGRLESAGFLLSLTSILGISVVFPALFYRKETQKKWVKKNVDSLGAGMSITLATLPVQLWFYYEVPVLSVLINLMVLPLMSGMTVMGLVAMLLPGGRYLGRIPCLILKTYEELCKLLDRLPFRSWNPGRPAVWQLTIYIAGLTVIIIIAEHVKRKHKWDAHYKSGRGRALRIGATMLLVAVFAIRPVGVNSVSFLDVGQGDCIVVRGNGGETFLFDCGSSSKQNVGSKILIPYLKYYGISRLDGIFISHFDADHYNGIVEILENAQKEHLKIGQIFLADLGKMKDEDAEGKKEQFLDMTKKIDYKNQIKISYLSKGFCYQKETFSIRCLHPATECVPEDSNAGSLCFLISMRNQTKKGGELSVLLTGDIQGEGEQQLLSELKRINATDITVLKVAHHGSGYSTSQEFLQQIRPQYAVISCGEKNRYGHPHPELIERLQMLECEIRRTDEEGAVLMRIK